MCKKSEKANGDLPRLAVSKHFFFECTYIFHYIYIWNICFIYLYMYNEKEGESAICDNMGGP